MRFSPRLSLLLLALVFMLSGCSSRAGSSSSSAADTSLKAIPQADAQGQVPVGSFVTAPSEIDGFVLNEYNEALTASGYFYATWTAGTPTDYTNSEGKEAKLYDAQIYMIVYEGTDAEDAASRAAGWLAAAQQKYDIQEESTAGIGTDPSATADCHILTYSIEDDANPYTGGASAFVSSGSAAVCVETVRTPSWEGDTEEVLRSFLKKLEILSE